MYDYDFYEFDSNGDGIPDTLVEVYDTTGDGKFDTVISLSDTDGDGYAETYSEAHDTNGSGMMDTSITAVDTTRDGRANIVQKANDYNQDGVIDSTTTYYDSNYDGFFEYVEKAYDSTGDGEIDTVETYTDVDGSGQIDYHEVYSYDPSTGLLLQLTAGDMDMTVGSTMALELDTFWPSGDYPDGISGDPASSMDYWECQGQTNRCALYSQMFVIEEFEGVEIDIDEFANVAKEHGWFTEEGGTTFLNMNKMLDYYGIDNEMSFHNSIDDIEECLNNGGKVIVSIDSDEIWHGEDNNIFAPDSSSDHAVEVIGIDRTDPEHPMVILNDSGRPAGRGEMVPLEVFEGAWEDGDCQMIECYPSN